MVEIVSGPTAGARVDGMQTREELYDIIGYHEAERALDALFSARKDSGRDTGREE